MPAVMRVSVVIPTHDRLDSLRRSLAFIARQSLHAADYEVVIVDDGSAPPIVLSDLAPLPFDCTVVRQPRQGPSAARNAGAGISRGEVLVFVDDDVCIGPRVLEIVAERCRTEGDAIVLGTLSVPEAAQCSVFARVMSASSREKGPTSAAAAVPFTECQTGLLALRGEAFAGLGGFQDPGGGWPNWDDVDFGYRASRGGFHLVRVDEVVGEHWDHALADLTTACRRWQRASQSAASLFRKHPAIQFQLPMFHDKTPPSRHDAPRLLLRKLARRLMSRHVVLAAMERTAAVLETRLASPMLLRPLYRWIIGTHLFIGFQRGLQAQQSAARSAALVAAASDPAPRGAR